MTSSDEEVAKKVKPGKAAKKNDKTKKEIVEQDKDMETQATPLAKRKKSPKNKKTEKREASQVDEFDNQSQTEKKSKFKKKKDVKDKNPQYDQVLNYMLEQNRPYSAMNIQDNLNGEIKKGPLQKILDQLAEADILSVKEYGKAKIYIYNQDKMPEIDKQEFDELSQIDSEKRDIVGEIKKKVSDMNAALRAKNAELTNQQIEEEIKKQQKEIEGYKKAIKYYASDEYIKVPDEVIKEIEDKVSKIEKEYKKRKRMCMGMIDMLGEGLNKKQHEIFNLVKIDGD